jgi:hypothetical protein
MEVMKSKLLRASSRMTQGVTRWLGSKVAWRVVLGLFLLEALWFAFSAQYPMAFDENYHWGLIKYHAQQWLPFFTAQPHDAGAYGAVVRDPSYLYHWIMSFPYQLASVFTSNQTAQIIVLRLINVGMFAGGLLLYRQLCGRLGVSRALTTSLLAVFVLIPVVPFLAAHINYDNLIFVSIPLTLLLSLRLLEDIKAKTLNAQTVLWLFITFFLSSIIKYPYLPVFVIASIFLVWSAWRSKLIGRDGWQSLASSFTVLSRVRKILLVGLVLVSFGLFAERYLVNIVSYHTPVPKCDAVISQEECMQYGPYGRDHVYAAEKPADFNANVFSYAQQWLYGMWYRLFFAINHLYATSPPLWAIGTAATVFAVLLALGITLRFRQLFAGKPVHQLVLWVVLGYLLVLFVDGFGAYKKTGQPVAINGRYLIPFLPLIFAYGGMAWAQLLRAWPAAKTVVASLVIAIFLLQGGGTMSFIVRSNDTWMWNNGTVRGVNRAVRNVASPFMLGKNVY